MKRVLLLLILAICSISISCSKDDDVINNNNGNENQEISEDEEAVRYYVKYEAVLTSKYIGNFFETVVNTDNGLVTFKGGKEFTETFGPVEKGFRCYIQGNDKSSSNNSSEVYLKIYVCRENEPFVLKATYSGKSGINTTYYINF